MNTIEDLDELMQLIYTKMKGLNNINFRDKETRQKSQPISYCCEYPLGNFELQENIHQPILTELKRACMEHDRKFLFGIYGPSGGGKSHFVDYICNEWKEMKQTVQFIPIPMRHMKLGLEEKPTAKKNSAQKPRVEKNDSAQKPDVKKNDGINTEEKNEMTDEKSDGKKKSVGVENMEILMKRLLFSYFFQTKQPQNNSNPTHRRSPSFLENYGFFVTALEEANQKYSLNFELFFRLIRQEMKANGKDMAIAIDDITDLNKDEQRSFLYGIQKLKVLIVFTTTFLGLPEYMTSDVSTSYGVEPSADFGVWEPLKPFSLEKKLLQEIANLDMKVDSTVLHLILNQFGLHPRSYGMFYHALMNDDILMKHCVDGRMGDALNHFVGALWSRGSFGSTGLLVKLMNDWDSIPFLLCISAFILDIEVDWQQIDLSRYNLYVKHKKLDTIEKLINVFRRGGIISTTTRAEEDGKEEQQNTPKPVKITPIFLKAWAWNHTVAEFREKKSEDENKYGPIESFSRVLETFFNLCVQKLTGSSAEKLIEQLFLLRLNCGKLWYDYTGVSISLQKLLLVGSRENDSIKVDYEALNWKDISTVKEISYFGDITSDIWKPFQDGKDILRYKKAVVKRQIRKIKNGVCRTSNGNISFDIIVGVPLKLRVSNGHGDGDTIWGATFTRRYCVELKSTAGRLTDYAYKLQLRSSNKEPYAVVQGVSVEFKESLDEDTDKIQKQCEKFEAIRNALALNNDDQIVAIAGSLYFVGAYYGHYTKVSKYEMIDEVLVRLSGSRFARYIQQIVIKSFHVQEKA